MNVFRENLLKDKTAFVTGGGSGIGRRMAERFAEHGGREVRPPAATVHRGLVTCAVCRKVLTRIAEKSAV